MVTFAARIVKARSDMNLTQAFVADKLSVTSQAVSLWERGEKAPDINKQQHRGRANGCICTGGESVSYPSIFPTM